MSLHIFLGKTVERLKVQQDLFTWDANEAAFQSERCFICLYMWLKPCTTAENIKQQEKRSLFNIEANTKMSTCNGVKSVWEDIMTSVIEKAGGWKWKWFLGPFWEFAEPKTPQAVKQMWLLRWQTKVLCCLKCRWGSRNKCHWAATMNSRLHRLLSFCTVCLQNMRKCPLLYCIIVGHLISPLANCVWFHAYFQKDSV